MEFSRPMFSRNVSLSLACLPALALSAALFVRQSPPTKTNHSTTTQLAESRMAAMPLVFEQNVGQAGGEVQFFARGQGYTLGLTGSETHLALRSVGDSSAKRKGEPGNSSTNVVRGRGLEPRANSSHSSAASKAESNVSLLKMRLV